MRRCIQELAEKEYDLAIIGGGIYGATAAWEAASRNLSVALIDRGDFACATSSNSHKIIHGGIRYLQHGDISRIRESVQELYILMKIAPHLIHLQPCLFPTYGHGIKGPEAIKAALFLYQIIGSYIASKINRVNGLKKGTVISKEECSELLPMIEKEGLTGAGIWYDGQVYNSERLVISFLESAASKNACLLNYVEMTHFIKKDNSVAGVKAVDRLTGSEIEINAKVVLNVSGPWIDNVLSKFDDKQIKLGRRFYSALNLVTRPVIIDKAFALQSKYEDDGNIINKGGRMYIITPWHNCSLIGTSQKHYDGVPDDFNVSKEEIELFLKEINNACPSLKLGQDDVLSYHAGLLPLKEGAATAKDVKSDKKYEIVDHEQKDRIKGLVSVVGVKYTTARDVSKKAIDMVCNKLGIKSRHSVTHYAPISGGDIKDLNRSLSSFIRENKSALEEDISKHIFFTYGTRAALIMKILDSKRNSKRRLAEHLPVIEAEIEYSLRYGMAMRLEDIIFRRTELASLGNPGEDVLERTAELAAAYHHWDNQRRNSEIDTVIRSFPLTH